jgi:sialidase-1
VAETNDGGLVFNLRNRQAKCRAVAVSRDGGLSWKDPKLVEDLLDPQCQGSLLSVAPKSGRSYWLFCNAAGTKRSSLTLRLSYDSGGRWPLAHSIFAGPAAYSDLAVSKDGMVLCLFECGERGPYEKIRLARIDVQGLVAGSD